MNKGLRYGIPVIGVLFFLSMIFVQETEAQVTANVTIEATCGLSFTAGSPIQFGDAGNQPLTLNEISAEETLSILNGGTVDSDVEVKGTNWSGGGIGVGNTKFADTDTGTGDFASKTSLTLTDAVFGPVDAQVTNDTFWQMKATVTAFPFSGAITQTITFTATCIVV